jgi:hypothetical protein
MSLTRRSFVGGAASALGRVATARSGWAQVAPPASLVPPNAAGRAFAKSFGEKIWADLPPRLAAVNADIRTHRLRTIPCVNATLLTGYPYNEFYDWDLYFENLYLSYYGVRTNADISFATQEGSIV